MASVIVETGAGLSTANSYISVVDATAYLAQSNRSEAKWEEADDEGQAAALVLAAQYIGARWADRFIGQVANENQALDWPRYGALKKFGTVYDTSDIPAALKQAQVEYALLEINTPGTLFESPEYDATRRPITSMTDKVDVLEVRRDFASGGDNQPATWRKFPIADNLLKPLLQPGGTLLRV